MREQRLVFGEDAERYDRARAGYPEALVDDVLAYAGQDTSPLRAVEVGAGTGKATAAFARRGVNVFALEPDGAMAAVAIRNLARFPHVRVLESSFEGWPPHPAAFDLVLSAQA